MKKALPYILSSVLLVVIIALLLLMNNNRKLDERITLRPTDKIPYGTYIAYKSIPLFFPQTQVSTVKVQPSEWFDIDSVLKGNQLFFVVSPVFYPSEEEVHYLQSYVENGNDVFISTLQFGIQAKNFFGLSLKELPKIADSTSNTLLAPPFDSASVYRPPGFGTDNAFEDFNDEYVEVLQRNHKGEPNFVRIRSGKGYFYLHCNPFLFSNYFLVSENNKTYLQQVFGLLQQKRDTVRSIACDEYFSSARKSVDNDNKNQEHIKPSPWRVLLGVEAFRWAFWTAIALAILYAIVFAKFAQKLIPVLKQNQNDSLEFSKIIGRLYFEKKDHHNLALKMCTYFLDFVRTRYLIKTSTLDDVFIKQLSGKSGYPEDLTADIVENIKRIQSTNKMNEASLGVLYHQFQNFYKTVS